MATAKDLRRIALSLDGTTEAPHFDRTAFKVRRIYATLAADGESDADAGRTGAQVRGGAGGVLTHTQRVGRARRHDGRA
jgi:hypothetical protein